MENSYAMFQFREAVAHPQMFFKIGLFKKFCKFHRKILVLEFLFKVAGLKRSAILWKRDSSTGAFQWNLGNTFFYRTPLVAASESKRVLILSVFC